MKKLLSIILALTFCLAAFSVLEPSASAADATISESEAKELIVKAEEFCRNVRGGYAHIHENSDEYRIDVDYGGKYPEYYYKVIEENLPGGSYKKCANTLRQSIPKILLPKLMLTSGHT